MIGLPPSGDGFKHQSRQVKLISDILSGYFYFSLIKYSAQEFFPYFWWFPLFFHFMHSVSRSRDASIYSADKKTYIIASASVMDVFFIL